MLDSPSVVSSIAIFLPGKTDITDVTDVSREFSKQEISHGIFNEPLTSTYIAGSHATAAHVKLEKAGSVYCRVHQFIDVNGIIDGTQVSLTAADKGIVLRVKEDALTEACRGLPPGDKVYFRLRIFIGDKTGSSMLQKIRVADRNLQSGYSQVDYLDFRLNEARTLPVSVSAMMRMENAPDSLLKLVAFLAAVPVESDIVGYKTAATKCRLLEHQIWNSYVGGNLPQGMVVYHWKKEDAALGVDDFSTFLKLQTRKSDWVTIIVYLAIAFGFGLAGNLAASYIQDSLKAQQPKVVPVKVTLAPGSQIGKKVVVATPAAGGGTR